MQSGLPPNWHGVIRCGCMASAGMAAVAAHRLPGGLRVGAIFDTSLRIGRAIRNRREAVA